jgi:hypothetical protein
MDYIYKPGQRIITMNRQFVVWGLLLFLGFTSTHIIVFQGSFYEYSYIPVVWLVLAFAGLMTKKMSCAGKKGLLSKKCNCAINNAWAIGIIEGVALSAAVVFELISISPFYLLSIWLIALGSSMIADGMKGSGLKLQIGLFWVFSAVFFPFVENYQYYTFVIGALVMALPVMVAGFAGKE